MKKIVLSALLAALSITLVACAPNISPDTISASNANQVQTALEGVIISKRPVTVKGDSNLLGTGLGAVAGGLAGSTVGGGKGKALATLGGAVLGGAAGNVIQDKMETQQGIEYIVKLTQEEGPSTTISSSGSSTEGDFHSKNSNKTVISTKSAPNTYVTIVQGQGAQVLSVGQKVLVAGVGTKQARIISTL